MCLTQEFILKTILKLQCLNCMRQNQNSKIVHLRRFFQQCLGSLVIQIFSWCKLDLIVDCLTKPPSQIMIWILVSPITTFQSPQQRMTYTYPEMTQSGLFTLYVLNNYRFQLNMLSNANIIKYILLFGGFLIGGWAFLQL